MSNKSKKIKRKSDGKLIKRPNAEGNPLISIQSDFSKELSIKWREKKDFISDDGSLQLDNVPFSHCVIKNLFVESEFTLTLQNDLLKLSFKEKSNDLYQFRQSSDLNKSRTESIKLLREFLYEHLRQWVQGVTNIPLNNTMDMSCAIYKHTDVLLCHDDELEGRRIAYILYLVPDDWNTSDGGSLDLYSVNEFGEPDEIVKSLTPCRNSFVFFEVTPLSFHQVSEILSKSKDRLSISGWFHGEPVQRPPPFIRSLQYHPSIEKEDEELLKWINPIYLDVDAVESIQKEFEGNSEAQLNDFLLSEKYEEVLEEIRSSSLSWKCQGPANKRSVSTADCPKNSKLKSLVSFLTSKPMFKLLTKLTGLELADLETDESPNQSENNTTGERSSSPCTPSCLSSIRCWCHGDYTLAHDFDASRMENALDAVLYFNCNDWNPECGGFTSYIVSGEDEELLTVEPSSNCLSLVYRDKETVQFVKFINDKINDIDDKEQRMFYDIACCYKE